MKKLLICSISLVILFSLNAQPKPDKMDWWKKAKFGMFIHWGLYSVPAGTFKGEKIGGPGEWIMNRGKIPVLEYKQYAKQFNPLQYNPESWVIAAKEAGMKYLVITSKHHDGFALFNTKFSDWNVVDATPYGEDLLKPLAEACHKHGIRLGFYYSQAQDWTHPGGMAKNGHWDKSQDGNMDEYIDKVAVPQVKEILSNYGGLDILWWDSPIEMTKARAEKFLAVTNKYPNLIMNDRLGGDIEGDIISPEQFIPATGFPGKNWETNMTMNDTWGFKSYDNKWKSTKTLIRNLIDIASKGGNYLLNVGPTSDGIIPQPSLDRLKDVGSWMKVNGEAIYGTTASPFHYLPWGRSTSNGNKLYLSVFNWPKDGNLTIPLSNKISKAYLLSNPKKEFKIEQSKYNNILKLTGEASDSIASVVVIEIIGTPKVLPIPSIGKTITASSTKALTSATNLTDGNPKNTWEPELNDKDRWVEIDLGQSTSIAACSIVEPWNPWDKKGQELKLEYFKDNQWITIASFKTNGTGYQLPINNITASKFRLKILDSTEPLLNEWILYRAD